MRSQSSNIGLNRQYNWVNTYLKVVNWKICSFEWFIHPLFWLYGSPLISYSVTVCLNVICTNEEHLHQYVYDILIENTVKHIIWQQHIFAFFDV